MAEAQQQTKRKFVNLTEDDIQKLVDNAESVNTKKQTKQAVKLFREYLIENSLDPDFEAYEVDILDRTLTKFYAEARDKNGQMYKKTTMTSYRQGIQRHLDAMRDVKIDIIKGNEFATSARVFVKQMKREGKAAVDHHPFISDADLEVLYAYLDSWRACDSAQILQHKVFIDVMLHFGRRGRENLRYLKRNDFAVTRDGKGALYAYKVTDELTKNHQTDDAKSEGRMYEIKESPRCPVRSLVAYIRKLNPKCQAFFQQARNNPKDGIYYNNVALGHNFLGSMMKKISDAAKLSRPYTNHSLRATTVHVLDAAEFPSRHIMSVTGHKSENSLKTYSGQTSEETKRRMSETLNKKTNATSQVLKTSTTSTYTAVSDFSENTELVTLTSSQEQVLLHDIGNSTDPSQLLNDGLDDIFRNYELSLPPAENETMKPMPQRTPMMPMPNLYNCSNVTINFNLNLQK